MIKFVASVTLPLMETPWIKEVTLLGPRGLWFWQATTKTPNVVVDLTGNGEDDIRHLDE